MVKLQIVKGTADRTLNKKRVCTVACCVDNAYGSCSSQSRSSKICSEPCANFVQVTSSCTSRCDDCSCLAG